MSLLPDQTLLAFLIKIKPTLTAESLANPTQLTKFFNLTHVPPNAAPTRHRIALEQYVISKSTPTDLGNIDGLAGPRTLYALELFQNKLRDVDPTPIKLNPHANFPNSSTQALMSFYGTPGTNHVRLTSPYPLRLAWNVDDIIASFVINKNCHDTALTAMKQILSHYGIQQIQRLGLDLFGGCYNNRVMRGGTRLSTHAFAAAIDWDPAHNGLRSNKLTARFARPEYAAFLDIWEENGWTSLGRERDFDWMHVQAVNL